VEKKKRESGGDRRSKIFFSQISGKKWKTEGSVRMEPGEKGWPSGGKMGLKNVPLGRVIEYSLKEGNGAKGKKKMKKGSVKRKLSFLDVRPV